MVSNQLKILFAFLILSFVTIFSGCAIGDEKLANMDFLKKQYDYCFEYSDVVFAGQIDKVSKTSFQDGGRGYGYSKYEVFVLVKSSFKGDMTDIVNYTVWYEGKSDQIHEIEGEALFCLSREDGKYFDPEGFGKLPINKELEGYADSLSKRF